MFNKIREIVEQAQEYGFSVENAEVNTKIFSGTIVGPTVEEFTKWLQQLLNLEKPVQKLMVKP